MERVKNSFHPYALDRLAAAGAAAAFDDVDYFKSTCDKVIHTRTTSTQSLINLGFEVLPSSTNFVFAKHPNHDAAKLFQALRERDIIVRYFTSPRINEYLRISIGTDQEMDAFIKAITEIISI